MVSPSVFDHLVSVWAHLEPFGPFQTKNVFLLLNTSVKPYFVDLGQKNHYCLKWPKKGSQMVKTLGLIILVTFGTNWTTLKR